MNCRASAQVNLVTKSSSEFKLTSGVRQTYELHAYWVGFQILTETKQIRPITVYHICMSNEKATSN